MTPKKKIIIVEDNDLYRSALKRLINAQEDMEVAAEAADGIKALEVLGRQTADLVLLDLRLPKTTGYEILRGIARKPGTKILVLSALEAEEHIREAMDAGADGYCFKDVGSAELLRAMSTVLAGETYISRRDTAHEGEKRKESRQAGDCAIRWAYFNSLDFAPGRLVNCSPNGLFFETGKPALVGATVLIQAAGPPREGQRRLPECLRSSALAEVKWRRSLGDVHLIGVRYHHPV